MLRPTAALRPITRALAHPRPAVSSTITTRFYTQNKDDVPSPAHVTEKGHELDVQSHSAAAANRDRKASESIQERGPRKNPKEGHPKAPEPVIGMEDESAGQVQQQQK